MVVHFLCGVTFPLKNQVYSLGALQDSTVYAGSLNVLLPMSDVELISKTTL